MSKPNTPQPPSTSTSTSPPRRTRTRNQLTIFLTGATLLTLSTLLTRRSLLLRHKSILPRFYHPSNAHPSLKINGRAEASQALGLATINVAGFFVMMGGGLLWAFDIGSVEELRGRVGGGRGLDGKWREGGKRDEGEEEEFEKWVASLTGRKKGEESGERGNRRWSAREVGDEDRVREERYAVVEPQAKDKRGKPR